MIIDTQSHKTKDLDSTPVSVANDQASLGDKYMALDVEPYSIAALTFTDELVERVHLHLGRTYKATAKLKQAVGATIAALLANAIEDHQRYGYRPMAMGDFTGMVVGYKPFKSVIQALEGLNLLEVQLGFKGSRTGGPRQGEATRMRAKPALFEIALRHGVTSGTWATHFRQMPRLTTIPNPILLRSGSDFFKGRKIPGEALKVETSLPLVQDMSAVVNDINGFNARQDFDLGEYRLRYLQRIFSQGDLFFNRYVKGGRLYAPGTDSYQQAPSERRALFRFNGEATVEIDIGSSFLTIFRVKHGIPFDPLVDAYAIPGLPRFVSKAWVNMTFGHSRHHSRWPKGVQAKYKKGWEDHGGSEWGTGDLQADHPYRSVYPLMLAAFPELANWADLETDWGDLQYIESKAVVAAVYRLSIFHDVPALPVHDSIRVPISKQELATHILSDAFLKHVGVQPVIKIK